MVTLHWCWSHFGYIKVHFQKTHIFPTDLNDFIRWWGQLDVAFGITFDVWGWLWAHFGVSLGSLLVYEGHFEPLWDHFGRTFRTWWRLGGNFGVILWSRLAFEGGFGGTLGLLWGHLRYMGVPLGSFWGGFGSSLGSVWVSVGDFVSLDGHFALMVGSLWVY